MAEIMEGDETKEIMNILLEIKSNMHELTVEEKMRAVELYRNLSACAVENLRKSGDPEKTELLEEIEERIEEIEQEIAAHSEDMLVRKNPNESAQEASA